MSNKELRKLAEEATPGPWHSPGLGEIHMESHDSVAQICFEHEYADPEEKFGTQADADFIAAANPAKVIELLDRIDRLEAENEAKDRLLVQARDALQEVFTAYENEDQGYNFDWDAWGDKARAALSHLPAPEQPSGEHPVTLTDVLQKRCYEWGVYWRSSDAHGVKLTTEQALELLRDALGVEVEIAATPTAEPAVEAVPHDDHNEYWLAWTAVCRALDKAYPRWWNLTPMGKDSACRAIELLASASPAAPEAAKPETLREIGLSRDTSGLCVVTVNGREVIRDNGDVISHFATLNWLSSFSAPTDKVANELLNCADDYRYLLTITENKDNLHGWLRMRLANIGLATAGAAKPEPQATCSLGPDKCAQRCGTPNICCDNWQEPEPQAPAGEPLTFESAAEAKADREHAEKYYRQAERLLTANERTLHEAIAKKDAALKACVEGAAKAIYQQWFEQPGYVQWHEHGNSLMQDRARKIAQEAIDAAITQAEGARG